MTRKTLINHFLFIFAITVFLSIVSWDRAVLVIGLLGLIIWLLYHILYELLPEETK